MGRDALTEVIMAGKGYIVGAPAGISPKDFDDSIPGYDPERNFLPVEDIDGEPGDGYLDNSSEHSERIAEEAADQDDVATERNEVDEILAEVYGFTTGEIIWVRRQYDELRRRGYGDEMASATAIGMVLDSCEINNEFFDHYDYADPRLATERFEAVPVSHGSFEREKMRPPAFLRSYRLGCVRADGEVYRGETMKFEEHSRRAAHDRRRAKESNARRARKCNDRETIRRAQVRADVAILEFGDYESGHRIRSHQFLGHVATPRSAR